MQHEGVASRIARGIGEQDQIDHDPFVAELLHLLIEMLHRLLGESKSLLSAGVLRTIVAAAETSWEGRRTDETRFDG